ncbi:ATP-binding protein [Aeromonas sanarellii]|uniref:ATP-binding protein n=1 Tax=Aeromonas sanarellii TaxID=633415 RepID=UPI003BA22581
MILKGRLFWKILLGFWLAIVLVSQLLWLGFRAEREPPEEHLAQQLASQHLEMAAAVLAKGGIEAATALSQAMSPPLLQITPLDVSDAPPRPAPQASRPPVPGEPGPGSVLTRTVIASDGQAYLLQARADPRVLPGPHSWLNIPPPMLWIGGLGGLLFSILFAWHLTRPMNALRRSFDRVARGDLGVRLWPALRWRRDELTEVAKEFDLMVERLQQLVEGREQLLHDVSHELRSPLARIQMAIGLAEQRPEKASDALARIRLETERMDRMIGELLTLSRAEQGHGLEQSHYDLLALVETVVQDARFEAQQSGVEIGLEAALGEGCLLLGHAELVRRAVDNVVRNALRFSQSGQMVSVRLLRLGQEMQLSIADRGPGVEEGKLAGIFDPFVRIGSPRMGKGYGLAIARKAVILQGGTIQARNRAQGGLRVTMTLPLHEPS